LDDAVPEGGSVEEIGNGTGIEAEIVPGFHDGHGGSKPPPRFRSRKSQRPAASEPLALWKNDNRPRKSGLIAEALLVAILLHALLALVLVDFGLTAFLDGAHGGCGRC
jgi:hypothetical protein